VPAPAPPRSRSTFTLFVLVAATLLVVGSTPPLRSVRSAIADALSPVRSFGLTITQPVRDWFGSVGDYRTLQNENERLRTELDDYKGRDAQAQDAIRERRELANLDKLTVVENIPRVTARVIGSSLSNFEDTVEIDRGSSSGISEGMPVATGAGLVGRVLSVNRDSARVLLVTDADMTTGVRLSRSGVVGLATGQSPGKPLRVTGIEPDTIVEAGESVVTSGVQTARFPNGIPVGTVRRAVVRPGSLEQEIEVDPLAELGSMTFVRVLLWRAPAPLPLVPAPLPTLPAPSTTVGDTVIEPTPGSPDPAADPVGDPVPITVDDPGAR
jgi:rod shape-determining protein MreC